MNKQELRQECLKKRLALSRGSLHIKSVLISRRVLAFLRTKRYVLTYTPFRKEMDPNIFIPRSKLYVPKVSGTSIKAFRRTALRSGFNGIKEPMMRLSFRTPNNTIDIVLVPGLAFDMRGYRIGYGGGFYDRFLPKLHALKVGITWDECLFNHIDNSKFDKPVDIVITERRIILSKLRR